MKSSPLVVTIALTAFVQPLVYAQSTADRPDNPRESKVTLADDAYHLKYWQATSHQENYIEWWYFNLYDTKNNLQAFFTYQIADPLNLTGHGTAAMEAVVYQGNNIINETDLFPLSELTTSYTAANVGIGQNSVSVLAPDTYFVSGSSRDGRVSWNLYYDRAAPSWFAGNRTNIASEPWQQMSWLVYMPAAQVCGTLTVDGQLYHVDSTGYHDHNWGEWDYTTGLWNWAQFSQPDITFELGNIVNNPNGPASIEIAGKRIVFTSSQYSLRHTKWATDPRTQQQYPTQTVFTAQNGNLDVRVVMDVQQTEAVVTGPPPSLLIFEQTCHFSGTVIRQDEFPAEIKLDGNGFKEYTTTLGAAQ